MRGFVAFGIALMLAGLLMGAGGNQPPTTVVVNSDGTITVSTTTTPNGGCIGAVSPTKYACNVYIESLDSGATFGYATNGGPTTIAIGAGWDCPCVAAFKVHAGQWKQYSADSAPFTP
jgi:hypothetical protein